MLAHRRDGEVAAPHDRHREFIAVEVFADELREAIVVLDQQHTVFERNFVHGLLRMHAPAHTQADARRGTRILSGGPAAGAAGRQSRTIEHN